VRTTKPRHPSGIGARRREKWQRFEPDWQLRPPGFGVRLSSAAFLDAISAASSRASRSGRSNIEMLTTLCRRARSLARAADDLHQRLLKHKTFVQAAGYQQMVALEQQLHRADEFSLAVTLHLWQRFI
jgi:hypothetical protein